MADDVKKLRDDIEDLERKVRKLEERLDRLDPDGNDEGRSGGTVWGAGF